MPKRNLSPSQASSSTKKTRSLLSTTQLGPQNSNGVNLAPKIHNMLFCTCCKLAFKVCYSGRNDIIKHMETLTHKQKYDSISSTPTVSSMFCTTDASIDKVAYAETLFANYITEHNCSFVMADHFFTDFLRNMF